MICMNTGMSTASNAECGKGGTACQNYKSCIINDNSGKQLKYCLSGDCLNDPLTSCQYPGLDLIPCGMGGSLCFGGKVCMNAEKTALCQSEHCLKDTSSSCDFAKKLPCGMNGGVSCPSDSDTFCALSDGSTLCLENQDCSKKYAINKSIAGAMCLPAERIACGKGGTSCPADQICVQTDKPKLCEKGDCMKDKSSCQPLHTVECGKGGTSCPIAQDPKDQTVCMLANRKGLCEKGDCLKGGAVCNKAANLACGNGGTSCNKNKVCALVDGDNTTLCIEGSCMQDAKAKCIVPNKLACGQGGTKCPSSKDPLQKQVCVKSDRSAECELGDCLNDSASQCVTKVSFLPCGDGGSYCAQSDQVCILQDKSALCTTIDCMKKKRSSCQSKAVLPCGKGGLACSDANQVCAVAAKNTICTSGDCMNDAQSSCVVPDTLPCGKGGVACEGGTVCATPNNVECRAGEPCANVATTTCANPTTLVCGLGGNFCAVQTFTGCMKGDRSTVCKVGEPCSRGGVKADVSGALCFARGQLQCGNGGPGCAPINGEASVCMLKDNSGLCFTPECMDDNTKAGCVKISEAPCGKGGIGGCPAGQQCKDTSANNALCTGGACMNRGATKCIP